ncbi:MAG: hypothetical protein P8183_22420, partial [Anaerolineae bacterium]
MNANAISRQVEYELVDGVSNFYAGEGPAKKYEELSFDEVTIDSRDAITIAEYSGGKLFRSQVGNECYVSANLSSQNGWEVDYEGCLEFFIDPNTGVVMSMEEKPITYKSSKPVRWLSIIPMFCCLTLIYYWTIDATVESFALSATQFQYPGSELIDQSRTGSIGLTWIDRTYHTSDDIETVLEFMRNSELPVIESESSQLDTPSYLSVQCNDNWWTKQVARLYYFLPCATFYIYQDFTKAPGTFIKVSINW